MAGTADPNDDRFGITPWRPVGRHDPLVPIVDLDHLVWLVESAAIPWVPTVNEAQLVLDALLKSPVAPRTPAEEAGWAEVAGRDDIAAIRRALPAVLTARYGDTEPPLRPTL
jgi:hypothetical protein